MTRLPALAALALAAVAWLAPGAAASTGLRIVERLPELVGIEPPPEGRYEVDWRAEPPGDAALLDLRYDRRSRTLRAVVEAGGAGREVEGLVRLVAAVPTPARSLAPGEVLASDDLGWMEIDLLATRRAIVEVPEQAFERAARRTLRPGEPILARDLRIVPAVERNATVTVMARTGGIVVETLGKALEAGAVGEMVRVQNVDSRRTVTGRVVEPGLVLVEVR